MHMWKTVNSMMDWPNDKKMLVVVVKIVRPCKNPFLVKYHYSCPQGSALTEIRTYVVHITKTFPSQSWAIKVSRIVELKAVRIFFRFRYQTKKLTFPFIVAFATYKSNQRWLFLIIIIYCQMILFKHFSKNHIYPCIL